MSSGEGIFAGLEAFWHLLCALARQLILLQENVIKLLLGVITEGDGTWGPLSSALCNSLDKTESNTEGVCVGRVERTQRSDISLVNILKDPLL